MNNWNLKDKKVLVTGGTKGIGKAAVEEMLRLGAEVLLTGRNINEVTKLAKELSDKGYPVKGMPVDVTKAEDIKMLEYWIKEN